MVSLKSGQCVLGRVKLWGGNTNLGDALLRHGDGVDVICDRKVES